jgi:hypothetical protein
MSIGSHRRNERKEVMNRRRKPIEKRGLNL